MKAIHPFESTDCRRVRPLLDDFIAEELSIETTRFILAHLETCPQCRREKSLRLQARALLEQCWQSRPVPSELEPRVRLATQPNWLPMRLAVALMLPLIGLLVYVGLVGLNGRLTMIDHLREIAMDHVRCLGRPADADAIPFDVAASGLDQAVSGVGAYKLAAIQDCLNDGAHFTHYIFESPEGRITVAVEPRQPNERLPVRPGDTRRMLDGLEVRAVELSDVGADGSVAVAALELRRHFVYVVADDHDSGRTLQLAEVLLPSIKKVL